MEAKFIKGLKLSELFFVEAVKPILDEKFPELVYSAGRFNGGSDVLGYDTPRSMDHDWGCRLELYLREDDLERYRSDIKQTMAENLPHEIHGLPTNFTRLEEDGGTIAPVESGPLQHRVECFDIDRFVHSHRAFNPNQELTILDWLTITQQDLRTIQSGKVFHDGLSEIKSIQEKLRWYPHDLWLYLLSAQWRRISQEEHFVGRCGQVEDELGSRVIAARMVHEMMGLCFLMERQHAPYSKWFGTAFKELRCAGALSPVFHEVFNAATWREREAALAKAYEYVAEAHNALGVTEPLSAKVSQFHSRPFLVIQAWEFADVIWDAIEDEEVKRLPKYVGSVDQFSDSTDVEDYPHLRSKLRAVYDNDYGRKK